LSLIALQDLASRLAGDQDVLSAELDASFNRALSQLADLNDPTFASVVDPFTRIKVESVQTSVELIRAQVRDELGPSLGVAAGFNALDGD
jgi:predicted lipoprotein